MKKVTIIIIMMLTAGVFGATEYGIIDSTVREADFDDPRIESQKGDEYPHNLRRINLRDDWFQEMIVYRAVNTQYLWWEESSIDSISIQDKGGEARIIYRSPLYAPSQALESTEEANPEQASLPLKVNKLDGFSAWMYSLPPIHRMCVACLIAAILAFAFFGCASLWVSIRYWIFFPLAPMLLAVLIVLLLGGCTPPAITVQREQTEKIAFDFLAEEKFYNCEAKTWVFPFGGPKDNLTLEVLQPGEGWRPVTDFGIAAWWKCGEVHVVDIKDRLSAAGCVMWRVMNRNFYYEGVKE